MYSYIATYQSLVKFLKYFYKVYQLAFSIKSSEKSVQPQSELQSTQ